MRPGHGIGPGRSVREDTGLRFVVGRDRVDPGRDRPTNRGLLGRERGRFAKKSRDRKGDYRQVRQAVGWKTGTTGRDGRFGLRAVFSSPWPSLPVTFQGSNTTPRTVEDFGPWDHVETCEEWP